MGLAGAGADAAGAVEINFFYTLRKKGTNERATPLSSSPALRYGATCGARIWRGLARTRFAQTIASPDPPNPALLGASRGARETKHPLGLLLRSAQLAQRVALAPARRGRAQQWPEWMSGCLEVRLPTPFWLRLRRGGCGVSMGVEAPMLRALTRRGCLSGARSAKRVPRRTPQPTRRRFAPQGSQTVGRLFFAYFLLAKQKKVSRPPGRDPASALTQRTHLAIKTIASTA